MKHRQIISISFFVVLSGLTTQVSAKVDVSLGWTQFRDTFRLPINDFTQPYQPSGVQGQFSFSFNEQTSITLFASDTDDDVAGKIVLGASRPLDYRFDFTDYGAALTHTIGNVDLNLSLTQSDSDVEVFAAFGNSSYTEQFETFDLAFSANYFLPISHNLFMSFSGGLRWLESQLDSQFEIAALSLSERVNSDEETSSVFTDISLSTFVYETDISYFILSAFGGWERSIDGKLKSEIQSASRLRRDEEDVRQSNGYAGLQAVYAFQQYSIDINISWPIDSPEQGHSVSASFGLNL